MKLDHIEKIEILPGITPLSNYHSILHLKEGIFMTYNSMKDLQDNYYQLAYPDMSLNALFPVSSCTKKVISDSKSNQLQIKKAI
jgi:hypothetical protein